MARINSQVGFMGWAILPLGQLIGITSAIAVPLLGWGLSQRAIAQTSPPCDPPGANEYLLMVVYRSPESQSQLEQALPRNTTTTVCDYLGTTVTRVGGFTDLDVANSWAQFLADIGGLQAFVARPAEAAPTPQASPDPTVTPPATPQPDPTATAPQPFPSPGAQPDPTPGELPTPGATASELAPTPFPQPTPVPTPQPSLSPAPQAAPSPTLSPSPTPGPSADTRVAYNPQVLGTGYAVLVDYANRPEVASQLQQVVTSPVGLVSYEQRPYLLATYTSDLTTAATLLRTLSDRNFSAVIVDSRRAVLLTPQVVIE
ncbi:MAG: hypothetical protein SFY66_24380 [Oculatellaceae cyanobacterium bins.114]|nr:hypothetical protein [Oculatellaceae cyanobacterium bins.114]